MAVSTLPTLSAEAPSILLDAAEATAACADAATAQASYWRAVLSEGAAAFAENFRVRTGVVAYQDRAWPLVLSDGPSGSAYPASLHCHYVSYPRDELHLVRSPVLRSAARAGFNLFEGLARLAMVDRTVQWNGWLFSTNPQPPDIAAAAPEITAALVRRFPHHAVVVRGLHGYLDPHLPARFATAGYDLFTARQIYLFDGRNPEFMRRYNVKTDLKSLRRLPSHRLIGPDEFDQADAPRMTELYRLLYLDKHSRHNPVYTVDFVRRALRERWLDFRGLRHSSGRLDAVCGSFLADGVATTPFFGHDTTQPPALGLYRLLVARLLEETAEAGRVLNYSSGAGAFKRHRGAVPVIEFNAIYTRHLPAPRRAAFGLLKLLINGPGRRFLEDNGV
jgi:hypothetical protein